MDAVEDVVVGDDTDGAWAGLISAFRSGVANAGLFRKGQR